MAASRSGPLNHSTTQVNSGAGRTRTLRATGVPARTTRRWLRWWRGPFTTSRPFVELSARLADYAATGLPPAFLPKNDSTDDTPEDP